jgi:hypothetical protein
MARRRIRITTAARGLHDEIVASLRGAARRSPEPGSAQHHPQAIRYYDVPKSWWKGLRGDFAGCFSSLRYADWIALASLLFGARIEEEGHVGNAVLRAGLDDLRPERFDGLDRLLDDFATGNAGITPVLLQRYPLEAVALMPRWSDSSNRWKRRTSVVTFTRRLAMEGEFIDEALAICERLRFDEEDLVRKGVGWALKDAMRASPGAKRRVIGMVKAMRGEGVSAVVTLYAVRDLQGAERESVLSVKAC